MPYKISKVENDARFITCGLVIPDSYYRVIDMTMKNVNQIKNLQNFGYAVEETEESSGAYTEDGRPVDVESLTDWVYSLFDPMRNGTVEVKYLDEPVKIENPEPEAPEEVLILRGKLDEKGIKYRKDAGVSSLRKKLEAN